MTTTLMGVFDDMSAANAACRQLESAGIDKQSIRVSSSEQASTLRSDAAEQESGGIRGFFRSLFGMDDDETSGHYSEAVRRGAAVVTVTLGDDSRIDVATDVLQSAGAIDIDERVEQWRQQGYTGYDEQARPYTPEQSAQERQKLQVVQEDLKVGKRTVGRGAVRVHRRVSETPVEESVTLRDEHAVVERTPVDRPATGAELSGMRDEDITIRETAEEPVVSKSARVVEEVSVGKASSQRKETVRDKVRRSDVEVERSDGLLDDGAQAPGARETAMARYAGPERRRPQSSGWGGVERRASAW